MKAITEALTNMSTRRKHTDSGLHVVACAVEPCFDGITLLSHGQYVRVHDFCLLSSTFNNIWSVIKRCNSHKAGILYTSCQERT